MKIRKFFSLNHLFRAVSWLALAAFSPSASAATVTWIGANSTGLWSDSANWTGGSPSSSNDLVFGSSTVLVTDINGDKSAASLTFTGAANYTVKATYNTAAPGVLYVFGANPLTVNGGNHVFNAPIRLRESGATTRTITNHGTLKLFGGVLYHDATSGGSRPATTITTVVTGSGTTYVSEFTRRFAMDNMAVIKEGSGALIITKTGSAGSGDYGAVSGGMTVNGGTLQVGKVGEGSGASASITHNPVTVNTGGRLAGIGTIAQTTVFGELRPGDNLGDTKATLTFSTNLSLQSGSSTIFQMGAADALLSGSITSLTDPVQSGSNDFIKVNQTLTIQNGAEIQVDLSDLTPEWGMVFDLFDFATGPTQLPDFSLTGLSGGDWQLDTSRFLDLGVVVLVPEPSRMMLGMLAVFALLIHRRRG